MTVAFRSPEAEGSVTFTQGVRDPTPGAPVVMVDTIDESRVGTVVVDSAILAGDTEPPQVGEHILHIVAEAFIASTTIR